MFGRNNSRMDDARGVRGGLLGVKGAAVLVVMAGLAVPVFGDGGAKDQQAKEPAKAATTPAIKDAPVVNQAGPQTIRRVVHRPPGAPVAGQPNEVVNSAVLGTPVPVPVVSEAPGIAAARERVKAQRAAAALQAQQAAAAETKTKAEQAAAVSQAEVVAKPAASGLLQTPPMRDPMAAGPHAGVKASGGAKLVVREANAVASGRDVEETKLAKLAKWIDADGSGAIESTEWRALHPALGDFDREFEQRYERANGSLRARALLDWDKDGDGVVSDAEREEARKAWERSRLLIVNGFDKDGDAKLDLLELRAFEGSLGGARMARGGVNGAVNGPVIADGQNGASTPRLSQYRVTTTRVATIVSTLDHE
jgi:hypothetical protein